MLEVILALIEANIIQLFIFIVFSAVFYHKKFPLGKAGFALFAFFIFPGFQASHWLGLKLFNTINPVVFLAFIVFPTIICLSTTTRIRRFTPLIVVFLLLLSTGMHYFLFQDF